MSERRMNDYKLFVKTVHIYSYEVYYLKPIVRYILYKSDIKIYYSPYFRTLRIFKYLLLIFTLKGDTGNVT